MNDQNPYAAPQTHNTRAVEYKPLPAVTVDPLTVRSFSRGALLLWVFDSPILFVIVGFCIGFGSTSLLGIAVYESLMLVGFYLLTRIQSCRAGVLWFWAAFGAHLLGTITILIECMRMIEQSRQPYETLLTMTVALHGISIVLMAAGMYRIGCALGASAIRKTSLAILCCAGIIAVISPLLWFFDGEDMMPRPLKDGLGMILAYSIWAGYITVLAMLYFAWQLPNEMRRRLQRNLPDEIQLPVSFIETASLADLNQLQLGAPEPQTETP